MLIAGRITRTCDRWRMESIFSTAPFFRRPVRDALRAAAGFAAVEVMVAGDPDSQDPAALQRAAHEFDLAIRAVHAPFLLLTRRVWGTEPVGKVVRGIRMAEHLGAPTLVVHPPYRWERAYVRWLCETMPGLADRAGVTVAVENMFPLRGVPGLWLHARSEYPKVTLDTSHVAVTGLDPVSAARALGDRLAHVHLSDSPGRGRDSHLLIGEGVMPLGDLLDELASSGFRGAVSLELDLRRYMDDPVALRQVLVRNREFCTSRIAI